MYTINSIMSNRTESSGMNSLEANLRDESQPKFLVPRGKGVGEGEGEGV
jgi:hypothetical protein